MTEKPGLPEDFGNPWMSNLEEIELPEPVLFTFETPGWYLLAGLVLGVGLWLAYRLWRRWQADAYRRAALAELEAIEAPQEIPELLKRVALVAYPRAQVADLYGDEWLGFLDRSLGTTDFSDGVGRQLPQLAYDPEAADRLSEPENKQLSKLARRWILRHRCDMDQRTAATRTGGFNPGRAKPTEA
jgi:hypothetical protein